MRKLALVTALAVTSVAFPALALDSSNSFWLTRAVTAGKIHDHLERLDRIADRNNGTRSLGTPGYAASVRYVVNRLRQAHYKVQLQSFIANLFTEHTPPEFERISPDPADYVPEVDFLTMEFSGAGEEEAELALANGIQIPPGATPSSSASGCDPTTFPDVTGKIALIQRGTCTFEEKAANAQAKGAIAVIIFNEGQPGRQDVLSGTLGRVFTIPVIGTTFAVGEDLYTRITNLQTVIVRVKVDATTTSVPTWNVLADLKGRTKDRDVVVGAHLDSVAEGPGINDNGSGAATLLTIAEQMHYLHIKPRNTVRFAFWGAEEEGLIGSTYYVDNLSEQALANIMLNLNFDMTGSPNFVRFVYDGDGTIGDAGPPGSDRIEQVFTNFFNRQHLASEPTEFDGRSDYQAFIENGIPAGGLFSGAEGIKTAQQAATYGGTAGAPYDACYHQACDDIDNLSLRSLGQLGKAAAHAVFTFAMTRQDIRPEAEVAARVATTAAASAEYRGPHLIR
jgi:Zn-dependent M28 family amino/carboxypeptidase